jgi:hypothetical protein
MTTPTAGNSGPYLDQQLHVLVDEDMRAFTLGSADFAAEHTKRPPREGDAVRAMLVEMIERYRQTEPERYAELMRRGRAELARRAEAADRRRASVGAQG